MSLTSDDKQWIATTIGDAITELVLPRFDEHDRRFDEHDKRFEALENDVSLMKRDLQEVKEDVRVLKDDMRSVKQRLDSLEGTVKALENDIKEIYRMIEGVDNPRFFTKQFAKLPDKEKILVFNEELLKLAKKVGVELPR
ncbi:hypothetical protein CR983_01340 [Candidatus Saccharibacteria bacterium]|nr:MAG: hypothetical protein CR983_01340 [Candidatus Saccharibacteria bacterium]